MTATLLVLFLAIQDDAARAKQLLEECAAALRKSKHILIEVEGKTEMSGRITTIRRKVTLGLPDLVRSESRQGDSEWLAVHDGQHYWYLDIKKNEYGQYPHQKRPIHDLIPAQLYLGESAATLLGSDIKVSKHKDGHAITWIVRGRGKPRKHWLWLSKDNLPQGYSEEGVLGDGLTAWERTDEYTKIDLDPKVDDRTFEFVPPADATMKAPFKPDPAEEPPKGEIAKEALEILSKSAAALRAGSALSYEAEISTTGPSERSWKLKVVAQRPERYRVEQAGILIVSDGAACWYYDGNLKKYDKYEPMQMPFGVAEKLLDLYHGAKPDLALRRAEEVEVAQEEGADVIAWVEGSGTRHKLRIDAKTRFPLDYTTETTLDGDTYRHVRKYTAFELSKEPPANSFKFEPPPDSSVRTQADTDWEGKLLAIGSAAPVLAGKDPTGKDISLADFKGKPVLVVFGSAALNELRWLQKMHDHYSKRGLVVLGVHWEDGAKAVRDRFASEKFTYSALSLKEQFFGGATGTAYGIRVMGTAYVIAADGKVLDGMVRHEAAGYTERKLFSALEKAVAGR